MEVQEPPLGRFIRSWDTVVPVGLLPPQARKSGLAGTTVGARIKPEPEPEPGSVLMADVPKLKGNSQSQSRMQGLIVWLSR